MKLFKSTPENCFEGIINYDYKTYYITDVLSDTNYKDFKIAYIDENKDGKKGTILCIHGHPTWSYMWRHIIPLAIQEDYRIIALDLPGFGKSKEPESSLNPKEYAEYIINLIPDTVEVLVGHSFGGKVAVHMSSMKNYKNLVLIGSPLIRKTPEMTFNLQLNFYKFINSMNLISDKSLEKYKNKHGSEDYKNAEGIMRDSLVKTVNEDLSELLPKIDTNVKLIWGKKDVIVPLSIGEEANTKFKDSQLTVFNDAGHNMLRRKSDEITKIRKEL